MATGHGRSVASPLPTGVLASVASGSVRGAHWPAPPLGLGPFGLACWPGISEHRVPRAPPVASSRTTETRCSLASDRRDRLAGLGDRIDSGSHDDRLRSEHGRSRHPHCTARRAVHGSADSAHARRPECHRYVTPRREDSARRLRAPPLGSRTLGQTAHASLRQRRRRLTDTGATPVSGRSCLWPKSRRTPGRRQHARTPG